MSGDDPVALARGYGEARNAVFAGEQGARDRLRSLTHPELVAVTPVAEMQGGKVVGIEGTERLLDEMIDAWETFDTEISNVAEINGRAVWDSVTHARSRGAGVPYESPRPVSSVLEFRDGLLYRWRVFPTRAEAVEFAEQQEVARR